MRLPFRSRHVTLTCQTRVGLRGPSCQPHHQKPEARGSEQEEVCVVLRGRGRIKIEILDVVEGDLVRVVPGVWRCTEAGTEGMTILAVGAPISEENDSELAQGWWAD